MQSLSSRRPLQEDMAGERPKGREGAGVRRVTSHLISPHTHSHTAEAGAVHGVPPDRSLSPSYPRFPLRVPVFADGDKVSEVSVAVPPASGGPQAGAGMSLRALGVNGDRPGRRLSGRRLSDRNTPQVGLCQLVLCP